MQERAKELYRKTFNYFMDVYQEIQNYRADAKRLNSIEDQADLAYVVREIEKLLDDVRKEIGKLERQSHMLTSVLYLKSPDSVEIATSLNSTLWIETEYCKAKPTIQKSPIIPKLKNEPAEYIKMMAYFGVGPDIAELDIVRVHWPNLKIHINDLLKVGKPTPPGINPEAMFTDYTLQIRKKKGILE